MQDTRNSQRPKLSPYSLRKLYLNLALKIITADNEIKVATHDWGVYSRFEDLDSQRKAMNAKMRKECFVIYRQNLISVRDALNRQVEMYLKKYGIRQERIWKLYFIENKTAEEIAQLTHYSVVSIQRMIVKYRKLFKEDVEVNENGQKNVHNEDN